MLWMKSVWMNLSLFAPDKAEHQMAVENIALWCGSALFENRFDAFHNQTALVWIHRSHPHWNAWRLSVHSHSFIVLCCFFAYTNIYLHRSLFFIFLWPSKYGNLCVNKRLSLHCFNVYECVCVCPYTIQWICEFETEVSGFWSTTKLALMYAHIVARALLLTYYM